jgi:RHS repeat-associated protein
MEYDGESNQYHTQFRQYGVPSGRWTSPDPLAGSVTNPQSLNRYAYALNNPTSFTDPTGLDSTTGYGPYIAPACPPLPPGLPASAYQQATKCYTWFQNFKYNVSSGSACIQYEYGCGTNSSMGDDIFDALGAAAYIGEPTGASITVDETGNFSVGFDIAQWMAEAGLALAPLKGSPAPNYPFGNVGCASVPGGCLAVFVIAAEGAPSATTGVLTPSATTPNRTFPPATPPLGFGWWPQSPWDTPLPLPPWPQPPSPQPIPSWPLPPSPQPVPTVVALVPLP